MAESLKREDAVLQGQLWAPSSYSLGGARIQCREVRINGPGLEGRVGAVLPFGNAARGMDPLFFDDLHLEYSSIPETILRPIMNN